MKNKPNDAEEELIFVQPLLPNAPADLDEEQQEQPIDQTDDTDPVDDTQEEQPEDGDPLDETDGEEEPVPKEKKPSFFDRWKSKQAEKKAKKELEKQEKQKKKQQKDDEQTDDPDDQASEGEETDKKAKPKKEKKAKPPRPKKKKELFDEDEKTNPKIRLYNDIVRHAQKYDTSFFDRSAVPDNKEMERIFSYVRGDYPELFWLNGYAYNQTSMQLSYRCTDEDGKVDIKQIERKRRALAKAAKTFTRGITRKTKPYTALLTIYRRLILTLDYDGVGLNSGAGRDTHGDDNLRSLYSALVEHKVVCAGYAVAMQYLLHSVGISCGYVISETAPDGSCCHAFNALRIGRECYYLDATWGDTSNTLTGESGRDNIFYDYCCVPLRELQQTAENERAFHTPKRELYPQLEKFTATRFEYFRHRKAYLERYDERELIRMAVDAVIAYQEKEMGAFQFSFRCPDEASRDFAANNLWTKGRIRDIFRAAQEQLPAKYKKKKHLLDASKMTAFIPKGKATFYVFPK